MCGRRCRQKSDNLCSSGTLKNPICVHQRLAPAGVCLSQTLNSDLDTYWKSLSWIPKHVFPQSTSLSSLIVSAESDCVLSGEQHLPPERVRTACLMIWRLFEVQQFVNLDGLKNCFRELRFGRFIIGLLTSAEKKSRCCRWKTEIKANSVFCVCKIEFRTKMEPPREPATSWKSPEHDALTFPLTPQKKWHEGTREGGGEREREAGQMSRN